MNTQLFCKQSHWISSLTHFLKIKRIFVLSGNINDTVLYETNQTVKTMEINQFLLQLLIDNDYRIVVFHDDNDQFVIPDASHEQLFDKIDNENSRDSSLLMKQDSYPGALILRFISEQSNPTFDILKKALAQLSMTGHPHNMIVCLFDTPKSVPTWLYHNYATVHSIDIGMPSENDRQLFLSLISDQFYPSEPLLSNDEKSGCIKQFARITQGLMLSELQILTNISRQYQISIERFHQLVRHYKFGTQSESWASIDSKTFSHAQTMLKDRIKGQDEVIHAVIDTLKRASIGLSGISAGNQINAPRAVLFFAGPTGVGKTELARCIADIFFGDQVQLFRMDMNEFSETGAEPRIFGAPRTSDQDAMDGCLIRQVSQYPASMIVFENIESAHPTVLDRLPKILTDGFITGPKGNMIFFSETIIVFTSSIGSAQGKIGDKKYDFTETGFMPKYEIVKQLIHMTVEDHFKIKLKRPKLFNCLGDNIFVFDFIRGPVIPEIIKKMVQDVIKSVAQRTGITISCSDNILETIHESVLRKDVHGARGIANVIEHVMINPFSRYIFDHQGPLAEKLDIVDIRRIPNQSFELYEIVIGNNDDDDDDYDILHDVDLTNL